LYLSSQSGLIYLQTCFQAMLWTYEFCSWRFNTVTAHLQFARAIITILQCCARNVTPDLTVITYVICLSKVQHSTALYKFEIWAYKPCFIVTSKE
jgi:hypothetical protein